VILDLKWSYGIEEITAAIRRQLQKDCQVTVLSASESLLEDSIKIAKSRTMADMVLALINPLVYIRVFRQIGKIRPGVLYIVSPHVLNAPVVIFCRLFTNAFVISHIHDPEYFGSALVSRTSNFVSMVQSRLSHRVYCWGESIKRVICAKFGVSGERVAVFRHGPGQETFYDTHEPHQREGCATYFSFIGSIQPRKGIEFFLKAAIRFNDLNGSDKAQFLLAGSGNLEPYRDLMRLVPNLVVKNRFIEDREVNEFLAESYALVLPYIGGVMQSSFVAIAYGNGCPVIVSRLGSLPEEVDEGRTGFIVDQGNAEQIAAAMHAIYCGDTRSVLSRHCVEAYRERFRWERIGEEFYRDMARLAGQPAPPALAAQEVRQQGG
jgi:glycosyltransferase involved in cell wall biosynthesis